MACFARGCLQTYRADGTCYWAQHYLAPLRNHDGQWLSSAECRLRSC